MNNKYKLLIGLILATSIFLIILTSGAGTTSNYYPNSTNSLAWYGGHILTPITLGKFRDTAYTSAQKNATSVENATYIEASGYGGTPVDYSCQGRTQVASCSGYSEAQCPSYYDANEYFCEFMGGEECVATDLCWHFPGHEVLFKITETRADINNLSIRAVSYGDRADDANTRTLAVYNWTKGAYITFMTSSCTSGLSNVICNLTANITDPLNFINTTGYVDVILYDPSAVPANSIRNYFDKVQINYNVSAPPANCWTKSGDVLFIPTGCVYNISTGVIT